ncbi:MAG: twin-arginine translocation pathway signal, partial [Gammaproteobacteria bacterium]|nr:twin-arginine translocation pathway signal [Gammaproteobacteria bacterium]
MRRIKIDKIKRRDFINGSLIAAGSALLGAGASGQHILAHMEPGYYPPARQGLRGSHPGANDHAHRIAWQQRSDWGSTTDLEQDFDLVVVGGGLSGLAAAYFYQQK